MQQPSSPTNATQHAFICPSPLVRNFITVKLAQKDMLAKTPHQQVRDDIIDECNRDFRRMSEHVPRMLAVEVDDSPCSRSKDDCCVSHRNRPDCFERSRSTSQAQLCGAPRDAPSGESSCLPPPTYYVRGGTEECDMLFSSRPRRSRAAYNFQMGLILSTQES